MKVRKTVPGLRKVNFSIKKANQGIRTSKQSIKRGLTSSVIGAEETESQGRSRSDSNFERLMFHKKRRNRGYTQNQYEKEQETQTAYKYVQWQKNAEKKPGINQPGNPPTPDSGNWKAQGSRKASTGMAAQRNGQVSKGMTVQGGKKAAAGTVEKAAKGAAAKGAAAAKTAVGTTAGAAAGAATAGTVTVVMALGAAAKRTEKRIRESLQTTVIAKNEAAKGVQKGEKKKSSPDNGGGLGVATIILVGVPFLILFLFIVIFMSLVLIFAPTAETPGFNGIVEVAKQELNASGENIGGTKYKNWYGMDADWCAIFVSWCANQCDYIELGVMPKTASVAIAKSWYMERNQYHTKESGYEPQAGDVIFFGNGRSHTGLVIQYDAILKTVTTIEGNTGSSDTTPYHLGSRVREKIYPVTYADIVGYGSPLYPEEVTEIPEPYGTEYSYMGWQMITSPTSKQYKLRQAAGMNFDGDGFGKIGDRYVIACTLTFGQVGDYVDWKLDNGTIIKTVVGDIKNQNDAGCNKWGHHNGLCVVEFVVDKVSWYGSGRYPTDFHPEWDGRVVRATKTGNYWE